MPPSDKMDLTLRKDLTIDAYQLSYLSTKKHSTGAPVFNFITFAAPTDLYLSAYKVKLQTEYQHGVGPAHKRTTYLQER